MSLDSILGHIINEANSQKEIIIQQAKKQAEEISHSAKQEADKIYQAIISQEKSAFQSQKQKAIVNARLEARKNLLAAKQELMDAVLEQLKFQIGKEKFKKKQILQDRVHEVAEDIDFYLHQVRLDNETEIARTLFG
jgi:vacuolar-type H+-ATPase subunit E/Vma4